MNSSIPKMSGIYKITCTINGRIYIGSSKNILNRWWSHKTELNNKSHRNIHLQRAWNKHGEQSFIIEVVELVMTSILLEREQYWLDKLKPFGKNGFNIAQNAERPTLGIKLSNEHRAKISAAQKGRKHSAEVIEKRAAKRRGVPNPKSGAARIGLKQSDETKHKRALSCSKKYIVTNPIGEELIVVGLAKFCREYDLDKSMMVGLARGRRATYKGWGCRYSEG